MPPLLLTSCMSEAADPFCRTLADYLAERLGMDVSFVDDIPWQERLERLYTGEIQAGWVCGLVYVNSVSSPGEESKPPVIARSRWSSSPTFLGAYRDRGDEAIPPREGGGLLRAENHRPRNDGNLELLAAPVMQGERYRGRPVYFSDVVVRRDSSFQSFDDLRGGVWAYNEPGSYSGYFVMLDRLAKMGEGLSFFGNVIESGGHITSLQMVLAGEADVAAIDSTAFDLYLQRNPGALKDLRVVESLGPNPIPPWVVARNTPAKMRDALRDAMLAMASDPRGRLILEKGRISQFVEVRDGDYDPIRAVVRQAGGHSR